MNSLQKITCNNPSTYHYIFRTDIKNYTIEDVKREVWEWVEIIEKLLGQHPEYYINTIKLSSRAENYLAKTGRSENGRLVINSLFFHNCTPNIFHSVIAHEVIHTFPGCFNHGENFRKYGRLLMNVCPHIIIARTICDIEYDKALQRKIQENNAHQKKYLIECQKCGQKIWRERRCSIVDNPSKYKCGICGGKFSVVNMFD